MTNRRNRPPRRAYAGMIAVLTSGILMLWIGVLLRHGLHETAAERTAALAARADLILLSARDWSRLHLERIRTSGAQDLPLAGLTPDTYDGSLALRYREEDPEAPMIECYLNLRHGIHSITRIVFWPAGW